MRVAIVGNFGLTYKATMSHRAIPIADELARRGHEVAVFVPDDAPGKAPAAATSSVPIYAIAESPATPVTPLASVAFLGQLALGVRILLRVWAYRPAVVYGFKPIGYAGLALAAFWLARRFGLTRATLALDADDWEGSGGWADREHQPFWRRWLVNWQEEWGLRHADVVTVASRELARLAGPLRRQTVYAPNAASPTSPGWRQVDRSVARGTAHVGERQVVLCYTRFVEFAPARLLDTFALIRENCPAALLLVAGQGLTGEERLLWDMARSRGLADAVRVLGWVPSRDLPVVFGAADVALYLLDDTLLNRAKCPMKLVDLLLAGVAVVADDVGQAGEYIVNERTGFLTMPGDTAGMARLASELLRDPMKRNEIGVAARADILERWTWTKQGEGIERALVESTA
jgi:glycosyltransferase involved in cell wall biosynthesis